jgi:hypothetical protein
MSKLYVFGIGGTGSRVLKALTMLMATGVKVKDNQGTCYDIVPIVIDPDHAAADFTRMVKLMQDYKKVRNVLDFNTANDNAFFSNNLNLTVLSGQLQTEQLIMNLGNTQNIDFKTYIGLNSMKDTNGREDANFALTSMLFSEQNLNSTMDVGFKGNPNIGSVVLNQFTSSAEFINFAASFDQSDRIFIISSIFGGTGASGFPLLLKNLRAISNQITGNGLIKTAPIGAISVFPYFDVAPDNNTNEYERSQIDSSTFISKTKAALSYYDKNMTEANVLYYIGDNVAKQYKNSEGGATQQNDAHFIELAASLAIVDFAAIPGNQLITNLGTNNNGIPAKTEYKEFGMNDSVTQILFSGLDVATSNLIKQQMTQFILFCKYMNEQMNDSKIGGSQQQTWAKDNGIDNSFLYSTFYQSDLAGVKTAYLDWLNEMGANNRAFTPFELTLDKKTLFEIVKGEKPKRTLFSNNYALFDSILNKQKAVGTKEHKFMEVFYKTTKQLVTKEKFNM